MRYINLRLTYLLTYLLTYSGMARVLKGFHTFTCTPTRSSVIRMTVLGDLRLRFYDEAYTR